MHNDIYYFTVKLIYIYIRGGARCHMGEQGYPPQISEQIVCIVILVHSISSSNMALESTSENVEILGVYMYVPTHP